MFIGLFSCVVGRDVYNKCSAYFEHDRSVPQVGDAGPRNAIAYHSGENCVEVGGGSPRIGNTRDSEGSYAVDINGKGSGNKYGEGIVGDERADNGNVAMEEHFLTDRVKTSNSDLTSEL